jgi:hypothetical protein
VLALGIEADPPIPDEFAPLPEVVSWIDANGGVPFLAHTYWSGLRTEQWEACEGLVGIEVWNAGCELEIGRGDAVTVCCSPAASVTLHAGRCRGARANAGRLGYPHGSRVLERDADGLITLCRLDRPPRAPYGRVEVADSFGRRAWKNPLWIA